MVSPKWSHGDTGRSPGSPKWSHGDGGRSPGSPKGSHGDTGRSPGSPKGSHGDTGRSPGSPKERFVTVYGRNPVIEVLDDPSLVVDKVVLAEGVRGHGIGEIIGLARDRGVPLERASADRVKKLAGNGRQDQGVFADVVAPRMRPLADALDDVTLRRVLLLDGITTPANVGMILRTATAAGIDGVVVPRRGVASIDPMVVKASAGVAFRAPILKVGTAGEAADLLSAAGFHLVGLAADGPSTLFAAEWPEHVCFVLGSETAGVGEEVADRVRSWVSIPMSGDVESLNVSAAAAVVCFELVRRSAR